jgi:ribose transport system permease protein
MIERKNQFFGKRAVIGINDINLFILGTHRNALRQMSVYGILACGMTPVIISAGIDLSGGSVLALAAVGCAKMAIDWNWPGAVAILAPLIICGCCGGNFPNRLQ